MNTVLYSRDGPGPGPVGAIRRAGSRVMDRIVTDRVKKALGSCQDTSHTRLLRDIYIITNTTEGIHAGSSPPAPSSTTGTFPAILEQAQRGIKTHPARQFSSRLLSYFFLRSSAQCSERLCLNPSTRRSLTCSGLPLNQNFARTGARKDQV